MKTGIFTAWQRGTIDEMLSTELPISVRAFHDLIFNGLYRYYGFDNRINAKRYIIDDISSNLGLPTWINVYE